MTRIEIEKQMFTWARKRSGLGADALAKRFPNLENWEAGTSSPTLKQLEKFAKATYAPLGFFFLPDAPVEAVPIPDFRTKGNAHVGQPSPDLLDMVYVCQQRQEWYRGYVQGFGEGKRDYVGSIKVGNDVAAVASAMRQRLGFDLEQRRKMPTWTDALRHFIAQADESGVLVMCSGVVLNNTRRKLNPDEFRGFSLADNTAPLIFINGADSKAAQMFTLAHELVHVWLGMSGVSDAQVARMADSDVERWCDLVAAEFLVPLIEIDRAYVKNLELGDQGTNLARQFKVSTLVILRRIYDAGMITKQQLWDAYEEELARILALPKGSGGDFYLTQSARVSKRFARALVASTLEGQTLFKEAFRMLGVTKHETFAELGRSLGMEV